MIFEYKAIKNNTVVRKHIESENEASVISYLKTNGYFPIEVHPAHSLQGISLPFLSAIKFSDIVDLTRQLSIMLTAGLTVVSSLDILEKQTTNKAMVNLISDINKKVKGGESFSTALKTYPQYFSNLYIALVRAGESSGKLAEIMLKLSENLEKSRELRGKLKGALIYPAVIITAMIVVMFIMITFVMPKLLDLYKDFDVKLPATTQFLVNLSSFSQHTWFITVPLVFIGLFFLWQYVKTRRGKYLLDRTLISVPVFGSMIRVGALVNSTRVLAVLIGAGVSMLESLNIVVETTDNVVYQEALRAVYKKVEKGESLGRALASEEVFPPHFGADDNRWREHRKS